MLSQGLSLNQAPPISIPFRFFLTAPIFGIMLGILFLIFPSEIITNRYTGVAVGSVHLFTLGILSMIIFGAMQQMMPVLAGAIIKKPKLFANVVHISLTLGTLLFSSSFIFDIKNLLLPGVILLALAFLVFFIVGIKLLFKVKYLTSTVKAMKLFVLAGLITGLLGVYLASSHLTDNINSMHYIFVDIHMSFGLLGFAVLIIMGVSFQVIPMFYVALAFPKIIQDRWPIFIFGLLIIFAIFLIFNIDVYFLKLIFAILLISYSYYGLNSLNNRRRPVFDVTLWYWKLSLYMFIISMLNWLFIPQDSYFNLAVLFSLGFLYSLLQGMVYKIIPFLAWFHLSSKGHFAIPTIREMINEYMIKLHFFLHVSAIFFLLIASFLSDIFIYIGASIFILSNILFLLNCISASIKYNNFSKIDPMQAMMANQK